MGNDEQPICIPSIHVHIQHQTILQAQVPSQSRPLAAIPIPLNGMIPYSEWSWLQPWPLSLAMRYHGEEYQIWGKLSKQEQSTTKSTYLGPSNIDTLQFPLHCSLVTILLYPNPCPQCESLSFLSLSLSSRSLVKNDVLV